MKDRIAEKALVLGTEGGEAEVRLVGGAACRKCGMARMGLCKPGGTGMLVRAENRAGAAAGDMVTLGIAEGVRWRGYALAYMLPLLGLLGGAAAGAWLGARAGVPGLETPGAFFFLALALALSLRRLSTMDRTEQMFVSRIVRDVPDFHWDHASEGEDYLRAYSGK
ncbi:MAG: SoxR reducing system RseC family protein [Nitrospirota bacterium]|jgi:positive regulator of sigma E activity